MAFHPSGFHLVVAFADKIQFMNVLSQDIKDYGPALALKACRELRFSNGGHMLAVAHGAGAISVYNFYTQECPMNMQLKGHNNKVRCIDWYEDDTGFSSCGMDGNAFHFDLALWKTDQKRSEELGINAKGVVFTGLCNIPGRAAALVVGSDKRIRCTSDN